RFIAGDGEELEAELAVEPEGAEVLPEDDVDEHADAHADDGEEHERAVERPPAVDGGDQADADGDGGGEGERGNREHEAGLDGAADHLANGALLLPGMLGEIEANESPHEIAILRADRIVNADPPLPERERAVCFGIL